MGTGQNHESFGFERLAGDTSAASPIAPAGGVIEATGTTIVDPTTGAPAGDAPIATTDPAVAPSPAVAPAPAGEVQPVAPFTPSPYGPLTTTVSPAALSAAAVASLTSPAGAAPATVEPPAPPVPPVESSSSPDAKSTPNAEATSSSKTTIGHQRSSQSRNSPARQSQKVEGGKDDEIRISDSEVLKGSAATLWRMALAGATEEDMKAATNSPTAVETLYIFARAAGKTIETKREDGVKTFTIAG